MTAHALAPVVVDSWAAKSRARNIALVVGLTLFTAVCAQVSVPLPFTPVPLTLQTFAVLAGAGALGAQRAVASQILYVVLAAAGAPVLAGGSHGIAALTGATGGYIAGFIASSFVVGAIARTGATRNVASTAAAYVAGTATIYLLGVSWLAVSAHMSALDAIRAGMIPFLVGDAIKAVMAGAILPTAWQLRGE